MYLQRTRALYSPQRIEEELPAPAASAPHVIADHPEWTLGAMVGRSPVMQRLFSQIRCTSRHLRIATIGGESGTSKALAAQTLHALGPVSAAPFIPCPAVQFFQHGPLARPPHAGKERRPRRHSFPVPRRSALTRTAGAAARPSAMARSSACAPYRGLHSPAALLQLQPATAQTLRFPRFPG